VADNYLEYWEMGKPPFSLTPDPEMLYLSNQHSECLMRLKYAIFSQKGGALLVSDNAGNGKTSVLAKLKKDLDEYYRGRVRVVFIDHPTLTPIEMIGEIAHQLGAELNTTEKIRALNHLRDRLFAFYNEDIKVVVIIDEGQMLKDRPDILGELRILLNFCVSDAFLLTFIFSGQKPLDSILREMPEFWQRLPVRFFLKNLDYNDTKALVQYRLEKVGIKEDIFTEDAFDGIYKYSDGCPRVICSVADLCLVIGFAKGLRRIGFVEVSTACRDMDSSGDGFHYYAYIKSREQVQSNGHEVPESLLENDLPSREALNLELNAPPAVTLMNSISCPACAEANPKERRFCLKCETPLYRKCPKCLTLIDTVSNECPVCSANIDGERRKTVEQARQELLPFDITEDGGKIWLQTKEITLDENERVLIIFPQGNFITPGPSVFHSIKPAATVREHGEKYTSSKDNCDLILTDKRLILGIGDDLISEELLRIDTCMVSDTGKLFGNRYVFIIGIKGNLYRIVLPYGSRKNKTIMDIIYSYLQTVILK